MFKCIGGGLSRKPRLAARNLGSKSCHLHADAIVLAAAGYMGYLMTYLVRLFEGPYGMFIYGFVMRKDNWVLLAGYGIQQQPQQKFPDC